MKKKVVSATTHDLDENWLMLAQAICVQAARDYEYLISDMPKLKETNSCNRIEIKEFAKHQLYTEVKMDAVIQRIDRVYHKEFRPFVTEHIGDIMKSWDKVKKSRRQGDYHKDKLRELHPFFCPNCGGILHPGSKSQAADKYIVCDGCNLNMLIPKPYRKR